MLLKFPLRYVETITKTRKSQNVIKIIVLQNIEHL